MRIAALGNDNDSLGSPRRSRNPHTNSSPGVKDGIRGPWGADCPPTPPRKNSCTLPSRVRILSTCVAVCFNGQFLTLNGCRCRPKEKPLGKGAAVSSETPGLWKIHRKETPTKTLYWMYPSCLWYLIEVNWMENFINFNTFIIITLNCLYTQKIFALIF